MTVFFVLRFFVVRGLGAVEAAKGSSYGSTFGFFADVFAAAGFGFAAVFERAAGFLRVEVSVS